MNAYHSRSRCLQERLQEIPDTRPVHVNRGRYLVSLGIHNDEGTLRRMAELLSNLLSEDAEPKDRIRDQKETPIKSRSGRIL